MEERAGGCGGQATARNARLPESKTRLSHNSLVGKSICFLWDRGVWLGVVVRQPGSHSTVLGDYFISRHHTTMRHALKMRIKFIYKNISTLSPGKNRSLGVFLVSD